MTDTPTPAPEAPHPEAPHPEAPHSEPVHPEVPHPIDGVIEHWIAEHILNSPVARVTDAYNHLRLALADLKQRILKEI